MEKSKVFVLCAQSEKGSNERQLLLMIREFLQAGKEVYYISPYSLDLSADPYLQAQQLKFPLKLKKGFLFWSLYTLTMPFILVFLALRHRPLGIFAWEPYSAILAKPAALVSFSSLLLFLRSLPWMEDQLQGRGAIYRKMRVGVAYLSLLLSNKTLVPTARASEELEQRLPFCKKKIEVFPFVSSGKVVSSDDSREDSREKLLEKFQIPERSIILYTSGVLDQKRNVEQIIRALSNTANPRLVLIVCGEGILRRRLRSIVVGLGLVEQVFFARRSENLLNILEQADVFILASRYEEMSSAMMRALSAGQLVLAAETGGAREILLEDELLFEVDNVDSLSEKLATLVSRKGELERLKALARSRASEFSFDWGKRLENTLSN